MCLINYDSVPQDIKETLNLYVEKRCPTGDFLKAVLSNDLIEAVGRADHINIRLLPEIVNYIYNNLPHLAWGSPERVKDWLSKK